MRIPVIVVLIAAGVGSLVAASRASDAHDPTQITWGNETYEITSSERGDSVAYDLSHDGRVVRTLFGSTDTLCDAPYIRRYDVDGDGVDDLLVYDCGHLDPYTMRDGQLVTIESHDPSLWASEVECSGLRLLLLGLALFMIGVAGAVRRLTMRS
ncbi:MAG TPA: hypothetical protein VF403_28740, partial [Kofleriaceae bacterium]